MTITHLSILETIVLLGAAVSIGALIGAFAVRHGLSLIYHVPKLDAREEMSYGEYLKMRDDLARPITGGNDCSCHEIDIMSRKDEILAEIDYQADEGLTDTQIEENKIPNFYNEGREYTNEPDDN